VGRDVLCGSAKGTYDCWFRENGVLNRAGDSRRTCSYPCMNVRIWRTTGYVRDYTNGKAAQIVTYAAVGDVVTGRRRTEARQDSNHCLKRRSGSSNSGRESLLLVLICTAGRTLGVLVEQILLKPNVQDLIRLGVDTLFLIRRRKSSKANHAIM
jgi:hypothetical protein